MVTFVPWGVPGPREARVFSGQHLRSIALTHSRHLSLGFWPQIVSLHSKD